MKGSLWLTAGLSLLSLACSGSPSKSDAGADAGGEPEEIFVDVSGKVFVYPEGEKYLADAGLPALSLAGLTLRVEEPFLVATGNEAGIFGSMVLDETGTFSHAAVSTDDVVLGIAAGVVDTRDAGISPVIRSATVLYDVVLLDKKPTENITQGKAYAVPRPFHDALTAAVGNDKIQALTGSAQRTTLFEAGFTLGRIVDASGKPLAGLKVTPIPSSLSANIFYPNAELTGTQERTSSHGIFLFVHNGGDVQTFKYTVADHPEYKQRQAGAVKSSCLVTDVYPGVTPP